MAVDALLLLSLAVVAAGDPPPPAPAVGARAFAVHCAPCHGAAGRGDGPAAPWLDPPARDLTRGELRWRTTPSGAPATEADVVRTIDVGVPGTSMPGWRRRLPLPVRQALARHVLSLAEYDPDDVEPPIVVPEPPASTPALVERGAQVYADLQCGTCHGPAGRGDGPSAADLKDGAGRPVAMPDLARPYARAGHGPKAVYRTMMTGLDGTPMPDFGQSIVEADRWPLVMYLMSLRAERGLSGWLLDPPSEQTP